MMITLKNPYFLSLMVPFFAKLIIVSILVIIVFLLFELLNAKSQDYRYRIKYFYLNWILVFSYVFFYFGLILYMRIKYLGNTLDLKIYRKQIYEFYHSRSMIDFIFDGAVLVLLLLAIVLVFSGIHRFFVIQLIKRFLILRVKGSLEFQIDFSRYLYLFRLESFGVALIHPVLSFLFGKDENSRSQLIRNTIWQISWRVVRFLVLTFPTLLLYYFLAFDLYFNDLILSSRFFKYLLFYFIFYTYRRLNYFIDESDLGLNVIIYHMYYLEKSYWYVNIPEEYQNVISRYLDLGLSRNMTKNPEPLLDEVLGHYTFFMATECCYHSKDGYRYTNGRLQFLEENNKRQDVIINYSFLKGLSKRIRKLFHILLLYVVIFLSLMETLFLLLLKYSTTASVYKILMPISNILLLLLPLLILIYCTVIVIYSFGEDKDKPMKKDISKWQKNIEKRKLE